MKKLFTASIVLIGLIATIHADDGYVFRNGYYYYGNEAQAYYRSLITVPGYYSYGAYYPGYSYYKYYPYTPSNPVAPAPALDWRSRTLDIAKIQVQYNAKREAEILEQKNYLEAIKALGLQGIGHSQGYGTIPPYVVDGHYQSTYLSGYGANASTVYGYNAYANANSNDFLAQLFQMANQQTINSQALTDKAQTGCLNTGAEKTGCVYTGCAKTGVAYTGCAKTGCANTERCTKILLLRLKNPAVTPCALTIPAHNKITSSDRIRTMICSPN